MNAAQCNAIGCDLVRPYGHVFCTDHESRLPIYMRKRLHERREEWLQGKIPAALYLLERIRRIIFLAGTEGKDVPERMYEDLTQLENLL